MTLRQARGYATHIVEWLMPFCDRIEVCGSVRRERPVCHDIDLVVIPKFRAAPRDLLGQATGPDTNLVWEALSSAATAGKARWRGREAAPAPGVCGEGKWTEGVQPKMDAVNFLVSLKKCDLDVFVATQENWASLVLCRTGSKEHNVWFAQRARDFGFEWKPYKGLFQHRALLKADDEAALYKALALPFIRPQEREAEGVCRMGSAKWTWSSPGVTA
jgi:DNA polymerase/3'-5' exonuclease PolX